MLIKFFVTNFLIPIIGMIYLSFSIGKDNKT